MTDYFYNAQASGANNGTSKTDAYTSISTALAALTSSGDRLFIADASQEYIGAAISWAPTVDCSLIVIDFATGLPSDMLSAGGYIGSNTSSRSITFAGGARIFTHGLHLYQNTSTTCTYNLGSSSTGGDFTHQDIAVTMGSHSGSRLSFGVTNNAAAASVKIKNLAYKPANAGHALQNSGAKVEIDGLSIMSGSVTSSSGLVSIVNAGGSFEISNYNVSHFTTACSLVAAASIKSPGTIRFNNGTHVSGLVVREVTSPATLASSEVWVYDASVSNVHINEQYQNAYGYMATSTVRYADDNISGGVSWRVITSAECNAQNPFYTPWIDWINDATSAITPYIEIARDFSSTPFTDAQIWLEVQAKTTSGSNILTTYTDRVALLGTPANQTSSSIAWTGLNATNNKMKLAISSITPAEVGAIRYRVGVAIASESFIFIDPQLRT